MKQLFAIISYLTLIIFSMNAYAYGPNVKLLSSKIDMSKDMNGGFIDKNDVTQLHSNGGALASAQAAPAYGKKTENIMIKGEHAFVIENRSGFAQQYVIEYKLVLSDGRFIRKTDTILVNNKSVARGAATSYTNQYFPYPGTYRFAVETTIRGEHADHKSDSNYVHVS